MFNQIFGEGEAKRVSKWIIVSLALLSLFLLVQVFIGFKRLPSVGREVYPQSTITVNGEGEAFAIPDIASFNFSVTEIGNTVAEAQEKLDEKINKALSAVRESGVEEKDIKTTSYNVYPKYEWEQQYCIAMVGVVCPPGRNVLKGYEVSQTVTVKVRDTEKAPDLVTKIGAVGVANISGLEFTVDNRDEFIAQARNEAIEKAREQAKNLSKQLGVKLGKMLYFNESGNYMPMPYYGEMGMGGDMLKSSVAPARAELPQGETRIVSQINITYEVK